MILVQCHKAFCQNFVIYLWQNNFIDAYVAGNAKQFLRLSPKIERNAKQYLPWRKKWALFCVSCHLESRWTNCLAFISTFDGCWCFYLAFLATFNLCWRFRRTFLVILGFNAGLVLRFFLHSNANGDIDASFLPQSELTRARNGVSYSICHSNFTINVRQWYNNR